MAKGTLVQFSGIATVKVTSVRAGDGGRPTHLPVSINIYDYSGKVQTPLKKPSGNEAMTWVQNNWEASITNPQARVYLTGVDGEEVSILGDITWICITNVRDSRGKQLPMREAYTKTSAKSGKVSKGYRAAASTPTAKKTKAKKKKKERETTVDLAKNAQEDRMTKATKALSK